MTNKYKNYETVLQKKFSAYDWTITDPENYDTLVWNSDPDLKPSKQFLDQTIQAARESYSEHRRNEYPSVIDQLDILYHQGFDAWKKVIEDIKKEYPKP